MRCFLYPDIGRVDEPLQLHMDGLVAREKVMITLTMNDSDSGKWSSSATTEADENGKLSISEHADSNIFSELMWNLRPKTNVDGNLQLDASPITFYIDIETTESNRRESRTVTRLFQEDYVVEEAVTLENKNYGHYFYPKNKRKLPSILVIGNSLDNSAKATAALFASHGYGALALNMTELNPTNTFSAFPIEPVHETISWLKKHPSTDENKVVLYGSSKGAELALLIASKNKNVHGVIAHSPSSFVFQGTNPKKRTSSWTENGEIIPFIPFNYKFSTIIKQFFASGKTEDKITFELYEKSIEKYLSRGKNNADIPVELVNGPILLISGKQDSKWPSVFMCEKIVERLKHTSFSHDVKHFSFEGGHYLVPPYLPSLHSETYGGSAEDNATSGEEAWNETVTFLKKHFPPAKIPTESIALQLGGR